MSRTDEWPLVSVIIPCRTTGAELDQCLDALERVDYPHVEILVITDEPTGDVRDSVRYLASGPVGPADKRDQGAGASNGEILAFIDDDAYPDRMWPETGRGSLCEPAGDRRWRPGRNTRR